MTIAKVRSLSKFGVITDVDPYNLPLEAWSMAVNARFKNLSVTRAPVFRRVPTTLAETDPRYAFSNLPTTGFDDLYISYLNGKVSEINSGVETDVSVFAYVASDAEVPWTHCHLGDVLYVNRQDRVPWYRRTSDSLFQALGSGWDSTWRAKIMRSCSSALVAFGVTKGATTFPTMVKTSEFAQVNTVPADWDETDPESNATENILAEMEGPITDAANLGDKLIIYGLNEAWEMVADGSDAVWRYRKLPFTGGSINVNCSIEVDGLQYVFGPTDIWVHDGTTKRSIAIGRVRDFIYSTMNISKANRFFVDHDRNRKEIRFNYVSGDAYLAFAGAEGCNRSAVFNYADDNWTFDDLPFVFGSATANLDITLTYATATQTYETIGGTYLDQEDSLKKVMVMVGDVNVAHSLTKSIYAVDQQGPGSIISYDVDLNATPGVTLERNGIDMDELSEVADNRGYKVCSSIFPQARFEDDAEPLMFSFGSANNYNQSVEYTEPQSYDGDVETRCDFLSSGRYLSMRVTHDDYHYFNFTGVDVDIEVTGQE